jgi:hypothetical protein
MSLGIVLTVGVVLSIVFHFIGVYIEAKKFVWVAIVLIWAAAISLATSEVKPKGYEYIQKIKGTYADTDALIEESLPEISIYEMIKIKDSVLQHKKNK